VNFCGLCSLYMHIFVDIIVFYFAFICLHVFFYVLCIVVVSTFLRISLFGYEHDMCAFLGSVDTDN